MKVRKEYLSADKRRNTGFPVNPKTLAKYACVGGGMKFRKFGRMRIVYKIADLDE